MKIYDLTHPIHNEMPVYPGTPQPLFKKKATVNKEGYRETKLEFTSHIGTHIDAPAHMLSNGKFLDQYPVSKFTGKAFVISIPEKTELIDKDFLQQFHDNISASDFIIFKTGWFKLWKTGNYFKNFPILSTESIQYLLSCHLKGIGMDAPSVDPVETTNWKNHLLLFENDLIIIENLYYPDNFDLQKGEFSCFPINYIHADGSPVRAVLWD